MCDPQICDSEKEAWRSTCHGQLALESQQILTAFDALAVTEDEGTIWIMHLQELAF